MDNTPNLSNLPATALNVILADADLRTIQILRKVCRHLRSHIDGGTNLEAKLNSVEVRAIPSGHLRMKLSSENQEDDIEYKQQEDGCFVTYDDREKLLENSDFATVAGHDLGLILRHQKSEMDGLALQFPRHPSRRLSPECLETFEGRFLASLEPQLRNRNSQLTTGEFVIRGTSQQSLILKVLPYLSPEALRRIEITNTKKTEKEPSPTLKMDEIVELDQWKKAREIYIDLLNVDVPLGSFNHFSNAKFEIKKVSTKELVELREAILKNKKFEDIQFEYKTLADNKKLLESFGRQYPESSSEKRIWYHKFPIQNNRALYIAWREKNKTFKFYSISLKNVPDNAF